MQYRSNKTKRHNSDQHNLDDDNIASDSWKHSFQEHSVDSRFNKAKKRCNATKSHFPITKSSELDVGIFRADGKVMDDKTFYEANDRLFFMIDKALRQGIDSRKLQFLNTERMPEGFMLVRTLTEESRDWLLSCNFGANIDAKLLKNKIRISVLIPDHSVNPMFYIKGQNQHRENLRINEWNLVYSELIPSGERLLIEVPRSIANAFPVYINYLAIQVKATIVARFIIDKKFCTVCQRKPIGSYSDKRVFKLFPKPENRKSGMSSYFKTPGQLSQLNDNIKLSSFCPEQTQQTSGMRQIDVCSKEMTQPCEMTQIYMEPEQSPHMMESFMNPVHIPRKVDVKQNNLSPARIDPKQSYSFQEEEIKTYERKERSTSSEKNSSDVRQSLTGTEQLVNKSMNPLNNKNTDIMEGAIDKLSHSSPPQIIQKPHSPPTSKRPEPSVYVKTHSSMNSEKLLVISDTKEGSIDTINHSSPKQIIRKPHSSPSYIRPKPNAYVIAHPSMNSEKLLVKSDTKEIPIDIISRSSRQQIIQSLHTLPRSIRPEPTESEIAQPSMDSEKSLVKSDTKVSSTHLEKLSETSKITQSTVGPEQVLETCSQDAEQVLETCSQETEQVLETSSQDAEQVCETCSQDAKQVLETCSQNAEQVLETSSQDAEQVFETCSQDAEQALTTRSQAEQVLETCSQDAEQALETCSQDTEQLLKSCSDSLKQESEQMVERCSQGLEGVLLTTMQKENSLGSKNVSQVTKRSSLEIEQLLSNSKIRQDNIDTENSPQTLSLKQSSSLVLQASGSEQILQTPDMQISTDPENISESSRITGSSHGRDQVPQTCDLKESSKDLEKKSQSFDSKQSQRLDSDQSLHNTSDSIQSNIDPENVDIEKVPQTSDITQSSLKTSEISENSSQEARIQGIEKMLQSCDRRQNTLNKESIPLMSKIIQSSLGPEIITQTCDIKQKNRLSFHSPDEMIQTSDITSKSIGIGQTPSTSDIKITKSSKPLEMCTQTSEMNRNTTSVGEIPMSFGTRWSNSGGSINTLLTYEIIQNNLNPVFALAMFILLYVAFSVVRL